MSVLRSFALYSSHYRLSLIIPSAKYASHHSKFNMEAEDRWRKKDGLTKKWNLIYRNPMDTTINYMTTYLTFSTGAMACCGVYYGFTFDSNNIHKPILLGDNIIISNTVTEGLIYVVSLIALHVALKLLISKFVIRIYQDGDNYMAIFRSHMYNSIAKHQFHLKDFKKLKPTLVVSWSDARFGIGDKKKAIILENYFKTPEHFNYLMYKKKAHNELD